MGNWGSQAWGQDSWSADVPAPTPPEPAGDGHFPFVCALDQVTLGPAESWNIQIRPVLNLAAIGFTHWIWHWMGEVSLISAGQAITMKVHRQTSVGGDYINDPVIGTTTLDANGLFHVEIPSSAIPALGSFVFYPSWLHTSVTNPLVTGALVVIEAWTE